MTSLGDKAEAFADEVATTITAALGTRPRIIAEALDDRFVVRTVDRGIQLRVDRAPIMALTCRWECELDHRGEYLSVSRSEFRVFVEGDRVPVFRFDFRKDPSGDVPSAHLQVHAERVSVGWALGRAGSTTNRARRRGRGSVASLSSIHLPVGGSRFRPALEDVLQMLIDEFGVDATDGWRRHLEDGRELWRRKQLRSAVRDAPAEAAAALRDLGFAVTDPAVGSPPERREKLRRP